MMRVLVGIAGALLIGVMLAEFFVAFLLPRRVKRDPRLVRALITCMWTPWRAGARRMRDPGSADTFLGFFGPVALLGMVALWSVGLILGFACLYWAVEARFVLHGAAGNFGDSLYFSASSFFNITSLVPYSTGAKTLRILEAAAGYTVLFVVIGYLPALFQAYSRRETAVSQLDAHAGSPPSASRLLTRSGNLGGWADLDEYLGQWETWAAELMETHLSYPIIGYYRSQHVNQNWLAALVTVLDASAFAIAAAPAATPTAEVTFAIGRHALADLAFSYHATRLEDATDRLDDDGFAELCEIATGANLELTATEQARSQLDELRCMYEPYAQALSRRLMLPLPLWVGQGEQENWRLTAWASRRAGTLH
jgi:hypothetical protein